MRRATLAALAALLTACPGGLNTGKGNDFPCDFSQPEGVRDQVCSPGDVCGVDNRCRRYRYEGPQFDNGASAPRFDAAAVKHPLLVSEPVLVVTRGVTQRDSQHALAVVGTLQQGTALAVEVSGAITGVRATASPIPPGLLTSVAVSNAPTTRDAFVVALFRNGGVNAGAVFTSLDLDAGQPLPLLEGDRLRSGPSRIAVVRLDPMGPGAFEVLPGGPAQPRELDFDETLPDGGLSAQRVLDVRYLPGGFPVDAGPDELLLTREGLFLSHLRVVQRLSARDEAMPLVLTSKPRPRTDLRHDQNATTAAFTTYDDGEARVLSTWRLDRRSPASAVRAWPDCSPCGAQGRVMAFAPVLELGAPFVEVLCALPGGGGRSLLTLLRVTGSAAADEVQACTVEQLEAPFLLAQVNEVSRGRRAAEGVKPTAVFDEGFGSGVALGGRRGQLWVGRSFSRSLPLFLERVPQAFGEIPAPDGGRLTAVLTDRYLAAPRTPALGYEVLDLSEAGGQLPEGAVGSAFVGQALGWGIASSGDLLLIDPSTADGGASLTFGPRLLDARGQPARGPFFGEAVTRTDGGLVSFVLTADDSLYFTPAPQPGATTLAPNVLDPLTPQLTPAPSSPIRSFTLERSAVGTDGVTRVRGYAVAGRSLFLVQLSGTPPRWSATPLVLQGGEPLEAWMDHPLGGLGRVGYRDGQVFTLPGGFLLVNELPRDAGTNPPQVLDYENLGGWPVAMTSNGLFEAHYDVVDFKLKNRFEDGGINRAMSWRRVTLPDGTEPWLGRPSRLHVTQAVEPYDESSGILRPPAPARARVFRLLVYTDEQVIEVGTLVRR